jgi:hypothetical protein
MREMGDRKREKREGRGEVQEKKDKRKRKKEGRDVSRLVTASLEK